ncbi:hypothetical protein [Acinetobacter baumannii]|uniref:hypothetical protein n=1 Tax=Acinetobacter baumannii TaxID=470 RepID=UPI00338F6F3A
MSKMRELQSRAGNPDLSHWKNNKLFSIAEAALLTCGIDPLDHSHNFENNLVADLQFKNVVNWRHAILLIRAFKEGICTHEIKSPCVLLNREDYQGNGYTESKEQSALGISDIGDICIFGTRIHRDNLHIWLNYNDYFEPIQPNTISAQNSTYPSHEPIQLNSIVSLPAPIYRTPALDAVQGVVNKFWVSYDPDGNQPPPKQIQVTEWIKANYPDIQAADICKYIDKICRHPDAKKGGNTKVNQQIKIKGVTTK